MIFKKHPVRVPSEPLVECLKSDVHQRHQPKPIKLKVLDASKTQSTFLQDQLIDVLEITSTQLAFAALKRDGSVVAWGPWYAGGDCSTVEAGYELDGTNSV